MSKFESGQLIQHKNFGYRGVIVSVDDAFDTTRESDTQESGEWYEQIARGQSLANRPWYHVLVHGSESEAYVAERSLELDDLRTPVVHPLLEVFFDELRGGRYVRTRLMN